MGDPHKRALVIVCHPDPGSFNHALAKQVVHAWETLDIRVTLRDLYAEGFNPTLTVEEFRGDVSRDAIVRAHIADLKASDLLAVIHPNCWGAPPAMMKGWIDRVFAPNAAYAFAKGSDGGDVPLGVLPIRVALVLNTGNTRADREKNIFGDPLDRMWRECVLTYCGVPNVNRELFGVVASSSAQERRAWLDRADMLARSSVEGLLGQS